MEDGLPGTSGPTARTSGEGFSWEAYGGMQRSRPRGQALFDLPPALGWLSINGQVDSSQRCLMSRSPSNRMGLRFPPSSWGLIQGATRSRQAQGIIAPAFFMN
jgi:hypothetical protein